MDGWIFCRTVGDDSVKMMMPASKKGLPLLRIPPKFRNRKRLCLRRTSRRGGGYSVETFLLLTYCGKFYWDISREKLAVIAPMPLQCGCVGYEKWHILKDFGASPDLLSSSSRGLPDDVILKSGAMDEASSASKRTVFCVDSCSHQISLDSGGRGKR